MTRSCFTNWFKGILRDYPLWFYYINAVTISIATIMFLPEPRYDLLNTAFFPLSLVTAFLIITKYKANHSLKSILFSIFVIWFIWILSIVLSKPLYWSNEKLRYYYEISVYIWVPMIFAHCYFTYGFTGLIKFYGVLLLYGFSLESSGIEMGFFKEEGFMVYLPVFAAPLPTMLGWTTVFYPCLALFKGLEKWNFIGKTNIYLKAILIATIAVFMDFQIDPVATHTGLWQWSEMYNQQNTFWLWDVPLINYVSWFFSVLTFALVYLWVHEKKWTEKKRILIMLVSIPFIQSLAGLGVFTTMGLTEGFNGPSWQILITSALKTFGLQ